jgi:CheY-like chemotaxis protein
MNARPIPGATALVVDDQEVLRILMCRTLESGGFRVLAAENGAAALNLFRRTAVDLLVTDYRMPGMTGLELARECCRLKGELSVLYISGSSPGDHLRADLAAAGKRAFLAKPFRQSELLRSAKAVLAMDPVAAEESHAAV